MKTQSVQRALLVATLMSGTQAHASLPRAIGWAAGRVTEYTVEKTLSIAGQLLPWGGSTERRVTVAEAVAGSSPFYPNYFVPKKGKTSAPQPQKPTQSNKQNVDIPEIITSAADLAKETQGNVTITVNLNNEHLQNASGILPGNANKHESLDESTADAPRIAEPSSDWYTSAIHWIRTHKFRCACYGLILTYAAIQASLISIHWSLMQDTAWSLWKRQCTLEDLYRIKQGDLINDLMRSLHQAEPEKGIGTSSLNRCIQEIDTEIESLKKYRSLVSLIDRKYLRKIFFYNERLFEESLERIQRLRFIRSTACAALNDLKQHHAYDTLFTHQSASEQTPALGKHPSYETVHPQTHAHS